MKSRLLYILMSLTATQALAVSLPEISNPPTTPLPIDRNQANIPCDQLMARLTKYNQMARQHDQSVTGFLGEVTQKLGTWHALLSPLEGTAQTIAPGTFDPLRNGGDQISKITDYAFDNTELLANELDRIIVSLRDCTAIIDKR